MLQPRFSTHAAGGLKHMQAARYACSQCFSLITIQPEQCFQPVSAKILPAELLVTLTTQ